MIILACHAIIDVKRAAVALITFAPHAALITIFTRDPVIQLVQVVTGEIIMDSYVKDAMRTVKHVEFQLNCV